jgi:hypothetical protein
LQPVFIVNISGAILPCIGDYDSVVENLLKHDRLVVFDTPEGTKAVVNGDYVLFYASPELGLFNLMFDGKAAISVKATSKQIESLVEPHAVFSGYEPDLAKKSSIIT